MDKAISGVGARGDALARQFVGLGNSVIRLGTQFGTILVSAVGVATGALTAIAVVGIREAAEAERVGARLEAVLAATGGAATDA